MHTPFTIEQAFSNKLKRLVEVETVIEITGFYYMKGKILYDKFYRASKQKFYYDKLKDSKSGHWVTILVTEDKRALLTDGRICKLRCMTDFKVDGNCSVELQLVVEEVIDLELTVDPVKRETTLRKSEIIKTFRTEEKQQNVSRILKTLIKRNKSPAVALVQPKINETLNDIKETLGEHWDKYTFKNFKVNIQSEREIIKTLKEIDSERQFNLIALFRGGGETDDFSVFDTITMGETVMELYTAFVMAVGHAGDEPFIQRVSDRSFPTPGDLGSYLRELYVNSGKEEDLAELEFDLRKFQKELNEERSDIKAEKEKLDNQAKDLQKAMDFLTEKTDEFNVVKEENVDLMQQIESINIKNRSSKYVAMTALSFGLLVVAVICLSTVYYFNVEKTPNISINTNSNTKTPLGVSNSKSR